MKDNQFAAALAKVLDKDNVHVSAANQKGLIINHEAIPQTGLTAFVAMFNEILGSNGYPHTMIGMLARGRDTVAGMVINFSSAQPEQQTQELSAVLTILVEKQLITAAKSAEIIAKASQSADLSKVSINPLNTPIPGITPRKPFFKPAKPTQEPSNQADITFKKS